MEDILSNNWIKYELGCYCEIYDILFQLYNIFTLLRVAKHARNHCETIKLDLSLIYEKRKAVYRQRLSPMCLSLPVVDIVL